MSKKFNLPIHKTKIVCTIGPSCRTPKMIEEMIKNGMNVARLNFSHETFQIAKETILMINEASKKTGRIVEIFIDLPGAKIRVGALKVPIPLKKGQRVTLSTRAVKDPQRVIIPVEYKQLPKSVAKGNIIFLSDGFIQLRVLEVGKFEVDAVVIMGGELRSHKGLNLPGAKMYVKPVTSRDLEIVRFGLSEGVTTFALSFVEKASDIRNVRDMARKLGKRIHLIAKIERQEAIDNFDSILEEADAIMVARGDMGVEIPVEQVPLVQKQLIRKANKAGIPVITATQMLMSMTQNIRPTRAEVNDVANAIIDGTDAVMLSEETAMGQFPLEAVQMIGKIAATTEAQQQQEIGLEQQPYQFIELQKGFEVPDVISRGVIRAVIKIKARYIMTPTHSGNTVRHVSRFKPPCWLLAFTPDIITGRFLMFSYGVYPFFMPSEEKILPKETIKFLKAHDMIKKGEKIVITQRQFSQIHGETDVMGIITV